MAAISAGACAEERRAEGSLVLPQSLRITCPLTNLGLPCDPDGMPGPLKECQGLCTFDSASTAVNNVCIPISELGLANLQRYPCSTGPGCSHTCNPSGECVPVPAEDGTTCFAAFAVDKCTGQCVSGACQVIPEEDRCAIGQDATGCGYRTCQALAAKTCTTAAFAPGTSCSTGTCNGCGVCSATPANCLCGNDRIDHPDELCDGADLNDQTCASVTRGAMPIGTLACSSSCAFVTSGCSAPVPEAGPEVGPDVSAGGSAGTGGEPASGGVGGISTGGAGGEPNADGAVAGSGGVSTDAGSAGSAAAFGLGRLAEGGGCDCRAAPAAQAQKQAVFGTLLMLSLAVAGYRRRRI
ncbi:MAG TPA: MYXO-CTERM sorting domain-containing protein [Polyangiaceae bacterium]|nr:MYXO-CTERM sorting domain-containing protein [Polyangiaceae bacterium]